LLTRSICQEQLAMPVTRKMDRPRTEEKLPIHSASIDQTTPPAKLASCADENSDFALRRTVSSRDRPGVWLQCAAGGLCVLAAAAAAVSFTAQYRLVYAARRLALIAGLEAAIPDAAALVFACLGVALALHGRHAVRARVLNVASAGASVFMNVIAAAPGWRDLAVWTMPPAAYALASDTLIGVVRAGVVARHQELNAGLVAEEATLLAVAGGLLLWLLRLSMAPASTLAGFRTWVLEECPVAPGRRASTPDAATAVDPAPQAVVIPRRRSGPRGETKTARFLALVTERHGPLAAIPLETVAKIAAAVAPHVELNPGSARTALRRAVLSAQNGDSR
jgi:hypothetical protein